MSTSCWSLPRRLVGAFGLSAALVAMALVLATPTPGDSQSAGGTASVTRVEEDWSLTVNQPDSSLACPQVSTQMCRSLTALRFCNLHLNSTDLPNFTLGGLQLQAWLGSQNLTVLTPSNGAIMATPNELVTWTQYMRISNGQLYFGIGTVQPGVAGASSQTWGNFSGIEIPVMGASPNLDNYDRTYSQNNSGVTFGANRVETFTLVAVRRYYSDGRVVTDSTAFVVYSSLINGL